MLKAESECVKPTQQNILAFLARWGGAHTVDDIRFQLDAHHGCVWTRSQIERPLAGLVRSGQVISTLDGRYTLPLPIS